MMELEEFIVKMTESSLEQKDAIEFILSEKTKEFSVVVLSQGDLKKEVHADSVQVTSRSGSEMIAKLVLENLITQWGEVGVIDILEDVINKVSHQTLIKIDNLLKVKGLG